MMMHDQKGHITQNFDHLYLRNAMRPLMVLSTSHDAGTNEVESHDTSINANGITSCQC